MRDSILALILGLAVFPACAAGNGTVRGRVVALYVQHPASPHLFVAPDLARARPDRAEIIVTRADGESTVVVARIPSDLRLEAGEEVEVAVAMGGVTSAEPDVYAITRSLTPRTYSIAAVAPELEAVQENGRLFIRAKPAPVAIATDGSESRGALRARVQARQVPWPVAFAKPAAGTDSAERR